MAPYYAHIRQDGKKQTVEEHLRGTGELCGAFASKFGQRDRGRMIGWSHDIGKCSNEFQRRLAGGPRVDHATAGALECMKKKDVAAAGCVAGHHSGLPDFGNLRVDAAGSGTLAGRLKKRPGQDIPEYDWHEALPDPGTLPKYQDPFAGAFATKMLYSCLVDADYLDTERFMCGGTVSRGDHDGLPVLMERLQAYVKPWFPAKTELNEKRCRIFEQSVDAAAMEQGAFSLTVPTGGGKTIASLAFALKHALMQGMDRVIYVIPYTSIIEQNADVFRRILGEKNVVEHHSGVVLDEDGETDPNNMGHRLATENWDAPVVVTTAVQFFESFYHNRSSQCRRLHNVANSVVIFDEAQMIPAGHLLPAMGVIAQLVRYFHTTAVLCTATQPVLEDLLRSFVPDLNVREICPDGKALYQSFRRVSYRNGGKLPHEALCRELAEHQQVLCIVNTRKEAQEIFDDLPEGGKFHLSTLMHPNHRRATLDEVRRILKSGGICRLVSTSLIEAGVDVDFPAVYRELAGLDSVAQAAGRCNREGKRPAESSIVTYFETERPVPLLQQVNIGAAREALSGGKDPGDPETIRRYFTVWRSLRGEQLDKSDAVGSLRKGIRGCIFPFETVANKFHFIDQQSYTVYIPQGEGKELCERIRNGCADRRDYRKIGQFAVQVYGSHYGKLVSAGDVIPVHENAGVLNNLDLYRAETGLSLIVEQGKGEFI